MQLVIGSKNYSSWSMRPWLLLKHFGLDFEEVPIRLFEPGYQDEIAKHSKSSRVPILLDNGQVIWDSLAICEYISETYVDGAGYPRDLQVRAQCRAYCAEMHSGFPAIRSAMPMNCRATRSIAFTGPVLAEVERIEQLWGDALKAHGGPFLFGSFSIADCMYAPVAMRFVTYRVPLGLAARSYIEVLRSNSAVAAWLAGAQKDDQYLPDFEIGKDASA